MSKDKYTLANEELEVLLMALEIFNKYGFKYPNIVKERHFEIAKIVQKELLTRSTDGKTNDEGTADA